MKQVIQDFRSGKLYVDDVPVPVARPGNVLVCSQYSLISAGTERSTVTAAQASLVGKARLRPDLVKQVIETYHKAGFAETMKIVKTKLATLKELGNSVAGTVLLSLDRDSAFKPGDRVACAGTSSPHAGIISVEQNLVAKVPDAVPLDEAAFTTLGSIALQGVRQANPRIGEFVCVIGLGLLGQITGQILRSNGCRVFGVDTSEAMVALARKLSCHTARVRIDDNLITEMDVFTGGHGFDSVIITASAKTSDPIELATAILRQKGVIVVVGAVPMNIPREPHFYQKELELKISCSYGPGRYDLHYEEEGHDYPYGYVRWTENRNMAAFLSLLETGSVDVKPLITHIFDIEEAETAYDIVMGKIHESSIGILLKYPEVKEKPHKGAKEALIAPNAESSVGIGMIGAGSFAQKFLIPNVKGEGVLLKVADAKGVTAKGAAEKFGFSSFTAAAQDVINDTAINTVFIATRHNTHGELVLKAIEAGKNVFVEKPLTIDETDLPRIADACRRHPSCRLQVGFNRRFAPLAVKARTFFSGLSEPLVVNYRVSAGFIPKDHWTQTEEGGGRILGEVCHFIDFLQYISGSDPINVFAECIESSNTKTINQDNVAITLRLRNGSLGVITYLACGDRLLAKERIEIFGGEKSYIIDDFRSAEALSGGKRKKYNIPGKGHKEEIERFVASIRDGQTSPIPLESILYTTTTAFCALDSLRTGLPQEVVIPD